MVPTIHAANGSIQNVQFTHDTDGIVQNLHSKYAAYRSVKTVLPTHTAGGRIQNLHILHMEE